MTARKPKKPINVERDARGVLEFRHRESRIPYSNVFGVNLTGVLVPLSLWHKARRTAKRMLAK